jgi:hypothetical protein
MKPTLGMQVSGEVAVGRIVAMSKEWCIYEVTEKNGKTHECAEPWDCVLIVIDPPIAPVSSVTEGPDTHTESES